MFLIELINYMKSAALNSLHIDSFTFLVSRSRICSVICKMSSAILIAGCLLQYRDHYEKGAVTLKRNRKCISILRGRTVAACIVGMYISESRCVEGKIY